MTITTTMPPALAQRLAAAIDTPRLLLEPMSEHHAPAFFAPLQSDEALYRWISMDRPKSLEALRAHWRRIEQSGRISPCQGFAWPAWALRRKADGQYLGRVDAEITPALEASNFGYYLFSPHWGQGYASEAAQAATQALAQRGVRRLVATVTVGNGASARVLQKAGFVFTRVLPGNDCVGGVAVDDEEYVKVISGLGKSC
ncbi:MAG: hypothetical protein C0423_11560 [Methylibium sp.]|nr:hypothetical protein [Methylibium sp.]